MKTRLASLIAAGVILGLTSAGRAQLSGSYSGSSAGHNSNSAAVEEVDRFVFDASGNLTTMDSIVPAFYPASGGSAGEQCWYEGHNPSDGPSIPYNLLFYRWYQGGSSGTTMQSIFLVNCWVGAATPFPAPSSLPASRGVTLTITPQSNFNEFDYIIAYDDDTGAAPAATSVRGHARKQ